MFFHFQKKPPDIFCRKSSSQKFRKCHRKTPVLKSLFNETLCLQVCNFFKKRLQDRPFLMKFAKFFGTPIFKNICERLLCISYDLHKYVSHVKKNCQRICAKFMNYLQRFHIIAILENPSKDGLSDSGGTGIAMKLLKKTK